MPTILCSIAVAGAQIHGNMTTGLSPATLLLFSLCLCSALVVNMKFLMSPLEVEMVNKFDKRLKY